MLRIHDLVFDAWGRRFFDHATVTLPVGAKVGLVGRNGAGKSTLFRLIQGQLSAGGGEIDLPRIARIGSVDQEHPATPVPLLDTVLAADVERARLTGKPRDRPARAPWRHLRPAGRHRRRPRTLAGRRDPWRPGFFDRRPYAPDGGVFRRLAHARGHGGGPVRAAGPAVAGRTHQLPRSGRRPCGSRPACGNIRARP